MNLKHLIIATLLGIGNSAMAQQSWTADNGNGTFTNPLFYDEFSDPDILRVGDHAHGTRSKHLAFQRPRKLGAD